MHTTIDSAYGQRRQWQRGRRTSSPVSILPKTDSALPLAGLLAGVLVAVASPQPARAQCSASGTLPAGSVVTCSGAQTTRVGQGPGADNVSVTVNNAEALSSRIKMRSASEITPRSRLARPARCLAVRPRISLLPFRRRPPPTPMANTETAPIRSTSGRTAESSSTGTHPSSRPEFRRTPRPSTRTAPATRSSTMD